MKSLILSILILSSCTVPRLSAPSADDLAGSPMVINLDVPFQPSGYWPDTDATLEITYGSGIGYTINDPGFYQPVNEIDILTWPKEGDQGVTDMPTVTLLDTDYIRWNTNTECDHVCLYAHIHYPENVCCLCKADLTPPPCDHIYIYTATPAKDSTVANRDYSGWTTTLEYRIPPDSIKVVAKRPCICLFCQDIKKCF